MNNKVINLYTWKANKLNQPDPKIVLKAMTSNNLGYDPLINAKHLAKMFTYSLPGNTIDIFYNSIADQLLDVINTSPELIDKEYLSNWVRIAINNLAE